MVVSPPAMVINAIFGCCGRTSTPESWGPASAARRVVDDLRGAIFVVRHEVGGPRPVAANPMATAASISGRRCRADEALAPACRTTSPSYLIRALPVALDAVVTAGWRCQRRIVDGVTSIRWRRQTGSSRARAAITARSVQPTCGRGVRRWSTASWWRMYRISISLLLSDRARSTIQPRSLENIT